MRASSDLTTIASSCLLINVQTIMGFYSGSPSNIIYDGVVKSLLTVCHLLRFNFNFKLQG